MGILQDAIALEERAETNYRSAAETTADAGAKKILLLLADEEARHSDALRMMKTDVPAMSDGLLSAAQDWIGGAIEGGVGAISLDASLHKTLQAAMMIEQETEAFYRKQESAAQDPVIRDLFAVLAGIEHSHYVFVSSLVEYFDRPTEWIEAAEFGLRDEY